MHPIYDSALPFYGDVARVEKDGKFGLMDPCGNVDLIWDYCERAFQSGLCIVNKDGLYGYIDEKLNIAIDLQYDEAEQFHHIINYLSPIESSEMSELDQYLARVKKDSKYGLINLKGDLILPIEYEKIEKFTITKNKDIIYLIKIYGKYGFVNYKGKYIINKFFDEAKSFWKKGYAPIKIKDYWTIIDINGDYPIKLKFQDIGDSTSNYDEYLTVKLDNKWGILDENLKLYMPQGEDNFIIHKNNKVYIKNTYVIDICES